MRNGSILVPALGLALVACAPRYRAQVVGSGHVVVGAPAAPAGGAPGGGGVALSQTGQHQVTMTVTLPRALRLRYDLRCPGVEQSGELGETFEAYKQRRLAELERERTQKKQAVGALTGAVLGQATAATDVQTPNAEAHVEAHADGQAAGEAVADQALAPVQLDPADTGARVLTRKLTFAAAEPGTCALSIASAAPDQDLTGVTGSYVVEQIVNLRAEARARHYAARGHAIEVRGQISASLVARGADPQKRARERAAAEAAARAKASADALARAEAEAARNAERARRDAARNAEQARRDAARARRDAAQRVRIEADVQAKLEVEQKARVEVDAALTARGQVVALLTRCGGDPNLRARLRAEADARHNAERQRRLRLRAEADARHNAERQRRLRLRAEAEAHRRQIYGLSIELRGRLRARLIASGADPAYRDKMIAAEMRETEAHMRAQADAHRRAEIMLAAQTQVVLEARAAIASNLVVAGAVNRPPPPAPPAESRPPVPFAGAVWVNGSYSWDGIEWRWQTGHWAQPPRAGVVWVAPARISVGGAVVIRPGAWIDAASGTRVKARSRSHKRVIIRDHRGN